MQHIVFVSALLIIGAALSCAGVAQSSEENLQELANFPPSRKNSLDIVGDDGMDIIESKYVDQDLEDSDIVEGAVFNHNFD